MRYAVRPKHVFEADNPQWYLDVGATDHRQEIQIVHWNGSYGHIYVARTRTEVYYSNMTMRYRVLCLALFLAPGLALARQADMPPGSWSGVIINSGCTLDEAFAESAKCTDAVPGAKLVLYDDTIRQMYDLDPATQAKGHLGESVTVRGSLEGNAIHVSSLEILNSFGLAVGKKAPAFSARDQLGNVQTLDTLRGSKGTVLLFFRSADW